METLIRRFLNLINKLKETSGRIDKENILKEYQDDDDIKALFQFIFNPYIVTGISNKKLSKYKDNYNEWSEDFGVPRKYWYLDLLDFCNHFKSHNTGTDFDVKLLVNYCQQYTKEEKELFYNIITKDVKVGVQPTTLNKIYGKDFIPQFSVQLAQKYFDDPEKLLPQNTDYILTTKLDGVRAVIIKTDESVEVFSRQGQTFENLVEIERDAKQLPSGYVYDGELLLDNKNNLDSKDLYRATMKIVSSDDVKRDIIFNCFDYLPIEDFKNRVYKTPCIERKTALHNLLSMSNLYFIKEVEMLYSGNDQSQITYWLDKITSEGGEGVMINISDAPYECKRTKGLLKVKKFQDLDLEILNIYKGTGKYSSTLGYIECRYKNNIVKVGSGFTDKERDEIINNPNNYIGKVATIKYFEESSNQQGLNSLRFPTWKGIRIDKCADI